MLSFSLRERRLRIALMRTAMPVRIVNRATKRIAPVTRLKIASKVSSTNVKSIIDTLGKRSTTARCILAESSLLSARVTMA
jgi:hypothetical protein